MGMIAQYMMIDNTTLNNLLDLDDEELSEEIFELEESEEYEMMDIDKMWDGLHFLLTGSSASSPIENDKLSEAITGVSMFTDDEDADFIAYTEHQELKNIANTLEKVDINSLKKKFDITRFKKSKFIRISGKKMKKKNYSMN